MAIWVIRSSTKLPRTVFLSQIGNSIKSGGALDSSLFGSDGIV